MLAVAQRVGGDEAAVETGGGGRRGGGGPANYLAAKESAACFRETAREVGANQEPSLF